MAEKTNAIGKIKEVINKLPFNNLAGKVPALAKVAGYANYAFCALVVVLLVLIAMPGKTSSAKSEQTAVVDSEMAKLLKSIPESPASDFSYELSEDGNGIKITKYKGDPVTCRVPAEIEGLPVVEISGRTFYFNDVKGLTTLILPDTVEKISSFGLQKSLSTIKLSASLKEIPGQAFYGCESLKKIEIPSSVTVIENGAFWKSGLESIYIPDSVTELGVDVFKECEHLKTVRLSSSIKAIPESTFASCTSLQDVDVPSGVTEIGERAFEKCSALSSLQIPNTVTKIGKDAFAWAGLENLDIPDSVTELNCSFVSNNALKKLHLPDSLTKVDDNMFYQKGLQSVNLPASTQFVSRMAFYGLEDLTELIIPESLTSIEFEKDREGEYGKMIQFEGTSLPIATQKRLKDLGYTGKFSR